MVGVFIVPEAYVGPTIPEKSSDPPQQTNDNNNFPKTESGGFFKHFEGFFKSFKKKVKNTKPDPPKTEINLSTAVKSIIQDTTTKTAIIGSRNIGKSFLINTLLESTAPSDKEYAEQRDAALFAEQVYRNTGTSFAMTTEPIVPDNEPITSYKGTTAYEFGSVDDSNTNESDQNDESYTYTTGYSFTEPEGTSVDDVEFEWEIGKIEQTLVPDENYINTIQWDKEKALPQYNLDNIHSFLMPQGVDTGLQSHCIEVRYGKIPELIVTFVDENKLRNELWEVHEVESGTRRIKDLAHKQLLEQRYRSVLGLKKQQKIPLGHIKSPRDFVLSPDILGLLGKSFRFRGLGENFNLDRIYVREKLRDVVTSYSYYVVNLLVKMPCGLLEGNKDLVEISSVEVPNAKTVQSIATANLLIVLLDKKGITPEIAETMRSTGFLEKALRSPEQHKAVFIEMSETSDKTISIEPSIKVEFESYKHCVSLQYKLLLSEQTANWPSIEKVVASTTVLSVRPRLFSLLHAGRDSPLVDKQSHLEALSATSIPALVGCIANMSISKCSEQLRDMNNEWMQRISVPLPSATAKTTAVPLDKAQQLLGREEVDEKMDEVTVMLDQLTVSFHDKFDRFRTEMVDTIESLDAVLVPKAQESFEDCNVTKAEGNALLAAYVSKLMSGPLAKAAPVAWSQNVAQVVPKKIQDLLNYSDAILKECVSLVERTEDTSEKSRLKTLVHFCQGTHERAVKRLEDFKKQLHSDTMPIVKDACVDAVFASMGNFPEISIVAAKNIKQKFSQKLKSDMQHLDMMEKDLQRALKSIMVVLKAKPNSSLKIEVQQSLKQLPLDLQFMKLKDEKMSDADLVMRYAAPEKYESRPEPWASVTSVYTAYEEVDTSRIFNKNSWTNLDPLRAVQFQEQLSKAGLVSYDVKLDASSQYRSLAHQVYGTEDAHSVVRLLLMSEILSNPTHYERYISMKGLDIQEYVSRSAKDTEWGDHLSLCAFANFYGSDLLIYSPMFSHPLLIQSKNPQTNRVFCISYINVNQYQSLKAEEKKVVEDMKIVNSIAKSQAVVSSIPKHYKVSEESKSLKLNTSIKCYSPVSLVQMCLVKITENVDMMPSLVGFLPEELTQRLLTMLISQRKVDDSVLERLVDSSMRTLELDNCTAITDASCRHIARSCDDLRRISLVNCIRIGNESLVQFSYQCPNLEYLNLSGCTSISNSGVTEIIRKSKNLQYLNLTGCSKITDAALKEISLTCPQLHTLIVKDCNKITDQAFHFVNKNIMVLDLSGCDLITDQSIVQIAKFCGQLTSLKVSSKNLTDESICILAERCRMLSVMDMSGCEMISDISVKSLGKNCPMIEILNVSCCKLISNESFVDAEIRPLFPNLISVDLSRCLNISDEAIKVIANDCDRLEVINLSSCEDITDTAIVDLVSKCNKLREINISKCMNITDTSALELAKCYNLEKLSLYNCHKITDEGLSQIGIGCSKLRELDISSCQNLTDISLEAITQGCPFIESLSIEECNITETGIISIAENCNFIQTLKLACCKGVTSNSIEKIGKGCPQLVYLDLSYCNQVGMSSLKKCLNLCPNLKYLSLRGFQHLTNESIEHANLQELNLSWCKNIVDAAVEQIAIGCPNLVNIDLAWANKITANSIHKLAQKVPTLRYLNLRGCAKVALLTLKYLSGGNITIYT